jgi:hypothetical protein
LYRPRELLGYQNQREQEKEKARCRYRAFNSSKTSLVSWRERGKEVLEIVATEQPDRFLQIAASLVPKGLSWRSNRTAANSRQRFMHSANSRQRFMHYSTRACGQLPMPGK